jgi:lysophospholipase L1-like esterase
MKLRLSILGVLCPIIGVMLAAFVCAPAARADDSPTTYYVSLGDSLAAGSNATGVGVAYTDMGYANQLYSALAADEPKLKLVKLGCPGESTTSMRFGSQFPTIVLSCATPRGYKDLYPKGTQLAEAVSYLQAHKGKVALVTIDIGPNDLQRLNAQGNLVSCLFEPAGCATQTATMVENLKAILSDLRAAAGPDVPIVGMSYYDVFAPICVSDPSLLFVCSRVDTFNGSLDDTYRGAGDPVADVAGAFENDNLVNAAVHVCAWTWFCSYGDVHPNTAGYGVIAQAFEHVVQ